MRQPKTGWSTSIKERDGYKCQVKDVLVALALIIPSLESDWECTKEVQAHHKTYERYGHELTEDGITVCIRCHVLLTTISRVFRFAQQQRELTQQHIDNERAILRDLVKGFENVRAIDCKPEGGDTPLDAQWLASFVHEQMDNGEEEIHEQARKDRCRSDQDLRVGILRRIVPPGG